MRRLLISVAAIVLFLAPAAARAQGLLVVVDPNEQVRLPRPVVIWPRPYPTPQPTPPPVSYKIKELDVQAGWSIKWPRCRCRRRSSTPAASRWRSRSFFHCRTTARSSG